MRPARRKRHSLLAEHRRYPWADAGGARCKRRPINRSEFALVAAAPEVVSILVVEHTLPLSKLVQVQVAAEVQLKERRHRLSERDVPGLGADTGEGLGR